MSPHHHANCTLLSVSVRELISQDRYSIVYNTNLYQAQTHIIHENNNLIYAPRRPELRCQARISHGARFSLNIASNNDRILIYIFTLLDDAAIIQLSVIYTCRDICPSRHFLRIRNTRPRLQLVIVLLKCLIRSECHIAEKSTLQRVLIHDNTVILIVTCKGSDRQNQVVTISDISIGYEIIIQCSTNGRLTITENVNLIIKSRHVFCRIDGETLFALTTAQLVTRRLIVVCERDHRRHESQNGGRMNLHVRCFRINVTRKIRNVN